MFAHINLSLVIAVWSCCSLHLVSDGYNHGGNNDDAEKENYDDDDYDDDDVDVDVDDDVEGGNDDWLHGQPYTSPDAQGSALCSQEGW